MKKVLLVTLFDEKNIGNRLQNYALQNIIEDYGISVTTLDNYYTSKPSFVERTKYAIKQALVCLGYKKYSNDCKKYRRSKQLMVIAKKFNKDNITNIKQISNLDAFSENWSDYDLAVAGSDQIWHKWRCDENELPFYYLQFMPKEKRVAYAASFGFEAFPEKDIAQHRIGIEEMRCISCREESGCQLIKELTGRQVPRVLDPTLLLSADRWRKIEALANEDSKCQKNYAFVYFLGNISDEYRAYIDRTVRELGIDRLIYFGDGQTACGPCEFLSLIDNARFVFTDSFHCTAFSTVFDKKFTVFRRIEPGFEKMFGRIEDLLSSTDKLEHIYGGTTLKPVNNYDELRNVSIKYLEMVLNIKNEN